MSNPQRTSNVEYYDKLWFLIKLAAVTVLVLFTSTIVVIALITKDPYALVGLFFPTVITVLWVVMWIGSKLYNGTNKKD